MNCPNKFNYEVMNTSLDILLPNIDFRDAKTIAYESFQRLCYLEDLLSMYRAGSDIAMLNEIPVGEVIKLADVSLDCLLEAFHASEISKGAIDVCMGDFFLKAKNDTFFPRIENPTRGKFAIDVENLLVQKLENGRIDLGGIGKGFGLDYIYENLLEHWEIKDAFISFGGSSILALGKDENGKDWQINLSDTMSLPIKNAFVGASGTSVLGQHIIDCRTGELPKNQPFRTWAISGIGAIADAMSTAFMILAKDEIKEICQEHNLVGAIQQTPESQIEIFE